MFLIDNSLGEEAVKALVEGEVTAECPASILKLHSDVTVFLDKESAALLGEAK